MWLRKCYLKYAIFGVKVVGIRQESFERAKELDLLVAS